MAKGSVFAAKRAAVSAKEARVSVSAEIKGRLWEAFPLAVDENRKRWFRRVAQDLTELARKAGFKGVCVTPRRIRAVMNGEARRIDHIEVKLIELRERINELEEEAIKPRGELNDIAIGIATIRADRRAAAGRSGTPAGVRAGEGARIPGGGGGGEGGLRQAEKAGAAVRAAIRSKG